MPIIYLSPSTQQANTYVTGGSEEYWMNLLADELDFVAEGFFVECHGIVPPKNFCKGTIPEQR